ncbi:MAG: hypothetical protein WED05_05975 [Candidatus Atabeyarchaeum deiterrae]
MARGISIDPVCSVNPSNYVGKQDLSDNCRVTSSGTLAFGGSNVLDFAHEHRTRCYIVDLDQIVRNAKRLVESFKTYPGKFHPFYATKANFLHAVVGSIVGQGYGIEVTNIHELFFALNVLKEKGGKNPLIRIVCNGVSKHYAQRPYKESLIEAAFGLQSREGYDVIVNLSSIEEVRFAAKIAQRMGGDLSVGVRVNPGITPKTSEDLATGAGYSRFGVPLGQLETVVKEIRDFNSPMKIRQLHCHIGSQISDINAVAGTRSNSKTRGEVPVLLSNLIELERRLNVHIDQVNIGGGIAVKYVKTRPLDKKAYGEFWSNYNVEQYGLKVITAFRENCEEKGYDYPTLCIEPGRWLTANSTALLLSVTDVFDVQNKYKGSLKGSNKWIITDGSAMTDAHDIVLLQQWFEVLNASKISEPLRDWYNIGGIACDSGDVFAWGRDRTGPRMLPRTDKGDVLMVLDVGAYQQALASHYNMLPLAPSYSCKGETLLQQTENIHESCVKEVFPEKGPDRPTY